MRSRLLLITVVVALSGAASSRAQGVVTEMTPELIAQAIKAGAKGDVSDGVITKSSGRSWGSIHIATFSTPSMRVAMAARQAKKAYLKFAPADVIPEMIAPELHVHAWSQVNGANMSTRSLSRTCRVRRRR